MRRRHSSGPGSARHHPKRMRTASGSGSSVPPRWWVCPRRMRWSTPRPTSSAGGLPGWAIVMTPVAYLVEQRPSGPPALVSFLPAFWLLVPGALGLIGVAEYLGQDPLAGVQDFLAAVGSMVAIGLGVLCGYPLYRSLARTAGRLQGLGSG